MPTIKHACLTASSLIFLLSCLISCDKSNCYPIQKHHATGSITCWEGKTIVFQRSIYMNGGFVCSVQGEEIDTMRNHQCIRVSTQKNVWDPPPPLRREDDSK